MTTHAVEEIKVDGILVALVIRSQFRHDTAYFFTPPDLAQQVGYLPYPAGHTIAPHVHTDVPYPGTPTQEVLVVRTGTIRVSLYGAGDRPRASTIVSGGDIVLLVCGGHGFEILEDAEIFEIKMGPYVAGRDRVSIHPVTTKP